MTISATCLATPIEADELDAQAADLAIDMLTYHWPRLEVQKHPERRAEMASYLAQSAERWDVPLSMLLSMAWFETTFRFDAKGYSRGEVGVLQVHGYATRGCNVETRWGAIDCGARWLAKGVEVCGDLPHALVRYGTGKCETDDDHVRVYVRRRLRLQKRLERLYEFRKSVASFIADSGRDREPARASWSNGGYDSLVGFQRRGIADLRLQNLAAFAAMPETPL